jgi:hypothetical protein
MRDLAKSMMTYGWAMSVFGIQQMIDLVTPGKGGDPAGRAAKALEDVTKATTDTLDSSLKSAFNAGDRLQGGMMDMMFGGFMGAGLDPNRWMRMGTDALRQMEALGRRATQTATGAAGGAGAGTPQGDTGATPFAESRSGPVSQ